jgi:23S rRNA (cytosine1962-C5)-methyltransferase
MIQVNLAKGKEKPVKHHHSWVFSGAIAKVIGQANNGDIVRVNDNNGQFLAYGYYNQASKITVRLLSWSETETIDKDWWFQKIKKSIERRKEGIDFNSTDSYRLIFSEADELPGLIVDKFQDYLVCQFLTLGIDQRKQIIIDALVEILKPKGIYERSDAAARTLEGIAVSNGLLYGTIPNEPILIKENNLHFLVDVNEGQKSGYFLDQRENRAYLANFAKGKTVLDCFSYSGGFSLYAKNAGAKNVTSVDSSALAMETLKANYESNQMVFTPEQLIVADVFQYLRNANAENLHWDLIILDPPKLAPSRKSLPRAERAYKDLNMQALKLMKDGDLLATFSCSGSLTLDHFKQILAWAAVDAGKELQFIHEFGQPIDHPVRSAFPESFYLKGLLCRVIS